MYVYGIRCAPADLGDLPSDALADYYLDYGLLVFPTYTRPVCLQARGSLSNEFWDSVRRLITLPNRIYAVSLEHPFISDAESAVVKALQERYPRIEADWYHVPKVAQEQEPSMTVEEAE
jgi:hypothetical protein